MSYSAETEQESRERRRIALERAIAEAEEPTILITFRHQWESAARPFLARGINGQEYVVKGQQAGRQIINDQIVARLGVIMGAPVGQPCIVEISEDLISEDLQFSYLTPGTAHATRYIPNCFDDIEERHYTAQSENRPRFALLSVLYGWVYANDYQFIYQKARPNLVYSVDHGHFFPNGPEWRENNLLNAPSAGINQRLARACQLKLEEIEPALLALNAVDEQNIVQAVASPPQEWSLTLDERVTLVEYLLRRQQELLEKF
jgi:hypothetical protein